MIRIATWNVKSYEPATSKPKEVLDRKAAFLPAMKAVDADIWVLTETWLDFSPGPGYKLVAQSSAAVDLKTWNKRRWVAIWVKRRLDAQKLIIHHHPDRMVCGKIKAPGQRDIVVVGTVLPWPMDELWPSADNYCAAFICQATEWGRLWGSARTSGFIVAGDFNQSYPLKERRGSEKGEIVLENCLKMHNLRCLTEGSNSLSGIPRIDHICISQGNLQPLLTPPTSTWPIPSVRGKLITEDYHHGEFADLDILPNP